MKGEVKKMAKNKTPKKPFIAFDESKTYLFGMRPVGTPLGYPEDTVEVHIENQPKDYTIKMYAPGYVNKYFFDIYFDWLIDTKKVKVVE